ncbi:MAG: acylphosphatase [Terriglobia bacterium]
MRHRISLEGIVQGVGFRPFVKRLADRFGIPGTGIAGPRRCAWNGNASPGIMCRKR